MNDDGDNELNGMEWTRVAYDGMERMEWRNGLNESTMEWNGNELNGIDRTKSKRNGMKSMESNEIHGMEWNEIHGMEWN